MTALRLALAAHLATNRIKLVHVWQTGAHWSAMMEWPYDPTARKPLTTEKHVTGCGADPCAAVLRGLDLMGYHAIGTRLFVLTYLLDQARRSL